MFRTRGVQARCYIGGNTAVDAPQATHVVITNCGQQARRIGHGNHDAHAYSRVMKPAWASKVLQAPSKLGVLSWSKNVREQVLPGFRHLNVIMQKWAPRHFG